MERISFTDLPEGLYQSVYGIENYLNTKSFDHGLLELMRYRVSQINGCLYCLDMHSKEAKASGETDLRLFSVSAWREADYYTEKERLVLDMAEKLTHVSTQKITDEDYERLQKHFSLDEIADLTLAIAQCNTWNRLMDSFRFEPGNYVVRRKQTA